MNWDENGVVKLHLAHSRQQGEQTRHVDDLLQDYGKQFVDLLLSEHQAHVYICGHVGMANACKGKCMALLQQHGGMSKITATQFMANMRINNRWQIDVWGLSEEDDIDLSFHRNDSRYVIDESRRMLATDLIGRRSLLE